MNMRLSRLVAVGGLALLVVSAAACGVAQAQGSVTPTPGSGQVNTDVGVSGTGRVFAQPDTAIASVGVEVTAATLEDTTSQVSTRAAAVIAKIKSLGVDDKDITTVGYSVNPITSNPKDGETPVITGYHAANIVQIKIRKLDDAGKILDAAIAAGANTLNGLYFTIDDPTSYQDQARALAVKDATARAQSLAQAAGVKLGPVFSITENVAARPIFANAPVPLAVGAAGSAPGPIQSGQNEIDVTVEMHFQIAQ